MAVSNRDRIHAAFELLGPAMNRFLESTVGVELAATGFEGGWIEILRAVKSQNAHSEKKYSADDPYDSLRMVTDGVPYKFKRGWDPIGKRLSRSDVGRATQLLEVRNKLAHHEGFSNDDASYDLDTISRFLLAIDAPKEAEEVARMRDDVRAIGARQADDRAARKQPSLQAGSDNLPPWREVISPHKDIQSDQFNAAEFAADLYTVANKSGTHKSEYTDPVEFFGRTYLTEGLRDLINRNVARLTNDPNASPVVNLQTNFGGGKTHSMLALWHLASGAKSHEFGDEIAPLAKPLDELPHGVRRVALVGNQMVPGRENDEGGRPNIRTMWGELAWQLGGQEAYEIVEASDRSSTNPGSSLRELFEAYSPAVILIDEWVAYARQLVNATDLPAGDFDTQFTFAQTLTEAARATPGIQVVISIPASANATDGADDVNDEEVGGEYGREALMRLKNVVGRTADQWQPANAHESFEIVRRRIFTAPDAEATAKISNIAKTTVDFYRKHHSDFPSEVRDSAYIDRIKQCYPIHPELFDRLYQDWSTLDRFQRTRGVLQLMNKVVGTLWRAQDPNALILPGTVPLGDADVVSEITKYLTDDFKTIITTDVAGTESVPYRTDTTNELFGKRGVSQRLARAVFMAATPGLHSAHRGAEKPRVFIGTALPGDVPGNFHSALDTLSNSSTYLYMESNRYWYDTQANITRAALDYAAGLNDADVWAEVERRLTASRKNSSHVFTGIHVFPETADVPDETDTRLVVVPMQFTHTARSGELTAKPWAEKLLNSRGSAIRTFKNSIVFLAADEKRARDLDSAVRQHLAWRHVAESADDLGLGGQQTRQAVERRSASDEIVDSRILETFTWALYPEQSYGAEPTFRMEAAQVTGSASDIYARTSAKLGTDIVTVARASGLISMDLTGMLASTWESGHISVDQLLRLYATYPYLPRLQNKDVLLNGLYSVVDDPILWRQNGFAFADAYDAETEKYIGLHLPTDQATLHISDSTLIVKPDIAEAQRQAEIDEAGRQDGRGSDSDDREGSDDRSDGDNGGAGKTVRTDEAKRRFFGSIQLDSTFPAKHFNELLTEVLGHLSADGTLDIRLEVTAENPSGFTDRTRRTVSENAKTLKFDQAEFETN
ncbi:hypothetical protein SAMN04488550_2061 [Gordonia malaquae]|uniref:Swt1-like HEPN domain-containing protein n=1 Tax=Gordonia malaquae NBRC 108250 TaxID=1223542 RepID=M3TFN3_GORML|nr:DUF499 domain-containing protein [Gordonia malaquae]GAC80241.1 hypothetical protein GM1_016_00020 [Gordonia malaquae NBRC 108250]SEC59228.1 hypothetical protein SAMN04488550_2061 [Gordonia malaquae]